MVASFPHSFSPTPTLDFKALPLLIGGSPQSVIKFFPHGAEDLFEASFIFFLSPRGKIARLLRPDLLPSMLCHQKPTSPASPSFFFPLGLQFAVLAFPLFWPLTAAHWCLLELPNLLIFFEDNLPATLPFPLRPPIFLPRGSPHCRVHPFSSPSFPLPALRPLLPIRQYRGITGPFRWLSR